MIIKLKKNIRGFSLLEIMVVISLFGIIAVIATQTIVLTLRSSRKSDAGAQLRESIDHSMAIIERGLRNAETIDPCLPAQQSVEYYDTLGEYTNFSCVNAGGFDSYLASGSARLTNTELELVTCEMSCFPGTASAPPLVEIKITAKKANSSGTDEETIFSSDTNILLRTY